LSSSWPPAKRSAAAASLARRGGVLQSESKGCLLHLFLGHSHAVVCADCCYVLGALRSSPSSSTWTDWAQRRVGQEQTCVLALRAAVVALPVTCAGRLRHRHRRQLAISRCILGGRWQMRYRTSHLALTASWPAHRCCRRVAVAASLRCTIQLWHTLIAGLGQRTSVCVALPLLSVMARLQLLRADSTGCRFEAVSAFTDMACTASTK
jgi:hypothetical protein